jgi:hypothetical protein
MKRIAAALFIVLALGTLAQAPDPVDAQGWFALGVQRHDAHDFAGALAAYTKARDLHYVPRPVLNIRMARAYAQTGDKEKAFALLEAMAANGFGQADQLNAQDELVPLRTDPRWARLITQMNGNARPCTLAPEFRQFDYWLGEWDVEIGGQKLAQSSIQLILNDCVIFENYTDSRGYAGKSFSLYDATSKKWEQHYVDTAGGVQTMTGGIEDGRMVFYWKTPQGLQRMSYTKEGADRVRQTIDVSADDGKTWTPSYNGLYIRKR